MSNMPDITKVFVGAKLPGEIVALARGEARRRGMSLTDFLQFAVQHELERCEARLAAEDAEWLASELRRNISRRENRAAVRRQA